MTCLTLGGAAVISDLIRPVWTWALWSWRRLALTVCVLCVIVAAATRAAQAPASHHLTGTHHAISAGHHRPAPALAAALRAGREFATAWVSHQPGWAAQLRRYATPGLAAQVTAGDHGYLPATAVTGPPTVVRETAGSVTVLVPTNAGPAVMTVVRSDAGWLATAVHLARVGD